MQKAANLCQATSVQQNVSASGRAATVKQLFDEHNRTLVSFLRARLRSDSEAQDAAQEAYVRMLELENLHAVRFLRSYLFRTAANIAIDRLRIRSNREAAAPAEFFDGLTDEREPEREALAAEQLSILCRTLTELPDKARSAFISYVFEGRSTLEIAARLRLTDRMIRFYIADALSLCRASIDTSTGTARPSGLHTTSG